MSIVLFTVIDLETTGLAPPASVIEIGVTRVYFETETKTAEIGSTESRLFAPKSLDELTPENIAVHHLTPDFLEGLEIATDDALAEIVQRDRPQFIVAANASFEMQWLDRPEIIGKDLNGRPPYFVCTVKAAARLFPDADSHSNQAMRYRLGLDLPEEKAMPPHRAGPDSFVTAHILAEFLKTTRVVDMVKWTLEPRFMTRCPIGKQWRGKPWADVDAGFLQWMLDQPDLDRDAQWWAAKELERRRQAA